CHRGHPPGLSPAAPRVSTSSPARRSSALDFHEGVAAAILDPFGQGRFHRIIGYGERNLRYHYVTTIVPRQIHALGKTGEAENHRSEEHTSELQSREKLVCRLLLDKRKGCL